MAGCLLFTIFIFAPENMCELVLCIGIKFCISEFFYCSIIKLLCYIIIPYIVLFILIEIIDPFFYKILEGKGGVVGIFVFIIFEKRLIVCGFGKV